VSSPQIIVMSDPGTHAGLPFLRSCILLASRSIALDHRYPVIIEFTIHTIVPSTPNYTRNNRSAIGCFQPWRCRIPHARFQIMIDAILNELDL